MSFDNADSKTMTYSAVNLLGRTRAVAMTNATFDVVVVGAGIFGSCTAYHCQKLGLKTLLLEKYGLGHHNGSSHGLSRIIRYAHTNTEYVPLVSESYRQIEQMEAEIGEKLWRKTGLLWISSASTIASLSEILKSHNIGHETISGIQIADRYPQFSFDDQWSGLVDPMGGVIYANKWLHTFQKEFVNLGGEIREHEEVLEYHERSNGVVVVKSSKTEHYAKKAIFTVGPWIKKLFPGLPAKVQPQSIAVCYWKSARAEDSHLLESENFPVFIAVDDMSGQFHVYGLPSIDHPGSVKICSHNGQPFDGDKHPEEISQEFVDGPRVFIKDHVPILEAEQPTHVDRCKYTVSEGTKTFRTAETIGVINVKHYGERCLVEMVIVILVAASAFGVKRS
nr:unnamed protein product [Haemonchus contortus]